MRVGGGWRRITEREREEERAGGGGRERERGGGGAGEEREYELDLIELLALVPRRHRLPEVCLCQHVSFEYVIWQFTWLFWRSLALLAFIPEILAIPHGAISRHVFNDAALLCDGRSGHLGHQS